MIVVCGEALVDRIRLHDGTERIVPGGGAFNTARALARLGVPTAFLGRLSSDSLGIELARVLEADGASLRYTTVGPEPTTTATAEIDSQGFASYHFHVDGTSAPNLTLETVPVQLGHDVDAICLGSLGLMLQPMASTLVGVVRRERDGRLVMLDPNVRAELIQDDYRERVHELVHSSTVVKASDSDLAWLYPDCSYTDAAEILLADGVSLVAVTLGADGAFGAHGRLRLRVAAPPVEVMDTIGAGDAFGAGLLAWLHDQSLIGPSLSLTEEQLGQALAYACLAASINCSRAGADPPWKREMVGESPWVTG